MKNEVYKNDVKETYDFFHSLLFCLCIVFLCGLFLELIKPFLIKFGIEFQIRKWKYRNYFLFTCFICLPYCFIYLEYPLRHLLFAVFFFLVHAGVQQYMGYSNVDINHGQDDNLSIAAFWAEQAFKYYYEIVFKSLNDRILQFEKKNNIVLSVRKLLIVVPLSCDTTGTLDKKDDFIEYFGDLLPDECDQAGNINRKYKNPVYKIHTTSEKDNGKDKCVFINGTYIVAEFPSPLGTLWKTKPENIFKDSVWKYQKQCFIKTLKNLCKSSPCIIVEYDDDDRSKSLSNILMSAIDKDKVPYIIVQ